MCIKNPKRLMFIKYNGPCKDKVVRFGRFMHESLYFIALFECEYCGRQYKKQFVSEDTLIEMGVPIETIIQNRDKIF